MTTIQAIKIAALIIKLIRRRKAEKREVTADDLKAIPDRKDRMLVQGFINSDFVGELVDEFIKK